MKRLLLLVMLVVPMTASAQEPSDGDRAAIRSVIEQQLAAFRRDDGVAAFSHAAPGIRTMFQTPDIFMEMVRRGYPPVYRPREVEFRSLSMEEGVLIQRVLLVGPDGVPVIARYLMERQPDGTWRIGGCVLEATSELAT